MGKTDGDRVLPPPSNKLSRVARIRSGAEDEWIDAVLVDEDCGHEWTTRVRAVTAPEADGEHVLHVAVDQEVGSDDAVGSRFAVGRPRVVESLLGIGTPMLQGSALGTDVMEINTAQEADVLIEHLGMQGRVVPFIVFSLPRQADGIAQARDWARRVGRRVEGIARVVVLGEHAQDRLKARLGRSGVWGGAVRAYMPGSLDEPWRHRFVTREDVTTHTMDTMVFQVAQASTRRRLPRSFDVIELPGAGSEVEVGQVNATLTALREQLDGREDELDQVREDHGSAERDLAAATAHLDRIKQRLSVLGRPELFWDTQYAAGSDEEPDLEREITDVTSAVLYAQEHLNDWLSIPDAALRDLDRLDAAPSAAAWGSATYRGLRALNEYARAHHAGFKGGFWDWCNSGHPLAWPATTKKLSMGEGDQTTNRKKFRTPRILPIDPAADPSGKRFMKAHLKIAEGGGNLAPRVYFFDDTPGPTGRIHVGLIGPHYLVPNTRT